jgi:hypothetical protein
MATIQVNLQDSFSVWRQKTNLILDVIGADAPTTNNIPNLHPELLAWLLANSEVTLVNAINRIYDQTNADIRAAIIKAIGMS